MYHGKPPYSPFTTSTKPYYVMKQIVQHISKSKRNVTFNNWFTSCEHTLHLLKQHKLISVGTLYKNRFTKNSLLKLEGDFI